MEKIIEAIKDAAKETMKAGASGSQTAQIIADKFGNAIARFIMIDIALDRGMIEETKEYMARF